MPQSSNRFFSATTQNAPNSTRETGAVQSTPFNNNIPASSLSEETEIEPSFPGASERFANNSDSFFPESSEGSIIVRVQTASGALPVPDATVIVSGTRNGSPQIVNFQLTDKSGATPAFSVPAPPAADSQTPSDSLPFSDYDITVRHPMYYTSVIRDVQVFGDQLTLLVSELTPLPELVNETDITRTINIPRQNL